MWLEAVLSKDDCVALAEQLLPLSIHFPEAAGVDHYVRLLGPADVSLVAGKGLRVTCNAEVRWPLLGVEIPIDVASLTMLLEPSIETTLGEDEVSFKLEIENAEVAWAPALFERGVVSAINAALRDKKAELSWQFAKTLSHVFELPALLRPLEALSLKVAWGKVRMTDEAAVFVVSFHTEAIRKEAALRKPLAGSTEDQDRATDPSSPPSSFPRRAVAAAGTLLGLVAGHAAFNGLYRVLARSDRRSDHP